jgi:hypothetical protein
MTTPAEATTFNGNLFAQPPTPTDSPSVYTDKTANVAGKNAKPVKEILIKFDHVQKSARVNIMNNQRQILTSILNAYKDEVTIFDKNNKPIDQTRINSITSIAHLRDLVDINTRTSGIGKNTKVRHIIIMKLRTSLSAYDLRTTAGISHQMHQLGIYIQEHEYPITDWDVVSVGWFYNLHPNHMSYDMIVAHTTVLIKAALKTHFPPKTEVPLFKLSNCSPQYEKEEMKTKAIQISCARRSSKLLRRMLTKAYTTNPIFVPWDAKREDPTWFKNCMRAQYKYLCNTWTLPLSGVSRQEMFYFDVKIRELGYIASIHPHRDTDEKGRWNLLLHKDNIVKAKISVQAILDDWDKILPHDDTVRSKWTFPRRAGKDRALGEDTSSNGDQTYTSASIASLSSILTSEDQSIPVTTADAYFDFSYMNEEPTNNLQKSYLEAAAPKSLPTNGYDSKIIVALEAELEKTKAEIAELKALLNGTKDATTAPTSTVTAQQTSTSTSTMTTPPSQVTALTSQDLDERHIQFENEFMGKMDQYFENLTAELIRKLTSPTATETITKKHPASDASSQDQSEPKKRDIKETPPSKSHPVADADMVQNP